MSSMSGAKGYVRLVIAGLAVLASLTGVSPGRASAAEAAAVTIGEVTSPVVLQDVDVPAVLRTSLEAELHGLDVRRSSRRGHAVMSLALVRMDSDKSGRGTASCVVSATLRSKRGGAVFAILEGRARAEGLSGPHAEVSVIQAAVKGAVQRVPDALK